MPASLSSCLALVDVALALRLGGVEERVDRGDRVVVGDVGLALEDGVDQRLAVDTERDSLAHPDLSVKSPSRQFIQI